MTTSEQWLTEAVKTLDEIVFDGELHTDTHGFQIYYGRVKGKKGTETVQPSDAEAVTLEDFFPTTIGVDYQTRDIDEMLTKLAMECIKAFISPKGKLFKKKCDEYYFSKPFTEAHATPYLRTLLGDVRARVERRLGEFPGKAVKFPVKEQKEKKPTKAVFFCPECGLEYTVPIKKLGTTTGTPTCICGTRCGRDLNDADKEKEASED